MHTNYQNALRGHFVSVPLLLLLMLCSSTTAWSDEATSACVDQPDDGMTIERDVMVTTRAGYDIAANIYRPDQPGQYPVIISMGPYGKDDLPAQYDGLFSHGQISVSPCAAFETPDPEYWTNVGYVVIAADSPGSGKSGGDLDLFGPIEAEAFYDLIEWAGVQPWSNGKVGLNGESYFGVIQWYVAALKPPHLAAIIPGEALSDIYRDVVRHGGIPSDFSVNWMKYRIIPGLAPGAELVRNIDEDMAEHPLFDDYWASWLPDLEQITVPAYVIASWPDQGLHTRGTLLAYEQLGSEQKWLEVHARKKWEFYYSRDSLERQRRFYDQFLKGEPEDMEQQPAVRYEARTGFYDGEIRHAADWPIPGRKPLDFYLGADSRLQDAPGKESDSLSYEPLEEGQQLSFSHTFERDTEITGTARLDLWVSVADANDMDIYVGLAKLDRHGREVMMAGYNDVENGHVASGWLRASHRELDEQRTTELRPFLTHKQEQKLQAGEVYSVSIEILPSSTLYRAGETLVLRIQGKELEGAGDITHLDGVNSGVHTIHIGGDMPSRLRLPLIPQ